MLTLCRDRLSAAPEAADAVQWRLLLGRALSALERWHELGVEMVRLLADEPDLTEAWLLDGEALLGQHLFDEAESALRRVLVARGDEAVRARALLDEISVVRRAGVPEGGDELYDNNEERTEIDPPGAGGRLASLLAPGPEPDFDDEATRERPLASSRAASSGLGCTPRRSSRRRFLPRAPRRARASLRHRAAHGPRLLLPRRRCPPRCRVRRRLPRIRIRRHCPLIHRADRGRASPCGR